MTTSARSPQARVTSSTITGAGRSPPSVPICAKDAPVESESE